MLQGSCRFGSERGVMGAGSGIAFQSDRGAEPSGEVSGSRQARPRHQRDPVFRDAGAGLTAAPRGIEFEHVRILAAAIFLTYARFAKEQGTRPTTG